MKAISVKKRFTVVFFLMVWFTTGISLAQTYTWQNVTIPAGGFVAGVDYSPVSQGLLYARTDIGGVYRWDISTSQWIPLTDMYGSSQYNYYGGESIAPDPVNANNVYVAAGMYETSGNGVILSSTNQGNSWTINDIAVPMGGNDDGREAGERLAVDPNLNSILYFGSRSNGLWKSTNSAASWSQVTSFPVKGDAGYGLTYVIFLPGGNPSSGAETIFVGLDSMTAGNSSLYRSTNAGGSWAVVPGGPTNMITPHASLGTDGNLWVAYDSGGYGPNSITTGQVWKLNTSTLAWTQVTMPGPPSGSGGFGGINVDAENAQHVVVSTIDWWSGPDMIFNTTNGGSSWTTIGHVNVGYGSNFANYNINGAEWTLGCGTVAGGTGWQGDVKIDPFNSANAIYTTGAGVWSSTNITAASTASITWSFTDYGLEETAVTDMTSSAAGGVFFSALGDIGGMRHTNLTVSPAGGMYCNPSWDSTEGIDFAELNTNDFVRVENSGAIATDGAYSTNNGQTLTNFTTLPETADNEMEGIAISANGATVIAVPWNGHGNSSYSTNWGTSWTACTGLPTGSQIQIASDRVDSNIFYATSGATLYVSTNGGSSFASAGTFAGSGRPRAVFGIAGEVWVPTGSGLYRFTNVGLGTVTTTKIANVSDAIALGFGMEDTGFTHPAVYLVGTVSGTYGFFQCNDGVGTTWRQINDSLHQFGAVGFAGGDETVYGRMYVGTNGRGILYSTLNSTATTPTSTPTVTRTNTATNTPTATPTRTNTSTHTTTFTMTSSMTSTQTQTATPTASRTNTATSTPIASDTPTSTVTATRTTTSTTTLTATATCTNTATHTATASMTSTFSSTPSLTPTRTTTVTTTFTMTSTATTSFTLTATASSTGTATGTSSVTRTNTATNTPTASVTSSPTFSPTATKSSTDTPLNTATLSSTTTVTPSPTGTPTFTETLTSTATVSSTLTAIASSTGTATATRTNTAVNTPTSSPTFSPTLSTTPTPTKTATSTSSNTATLVSTVTDTPTTPANTATMTFTASSTASSSGTATPSPTMTRTSTLTGTATSSSTPSFTLTLTATNSLTSTVTSSFSPTGTPTSSPTVTFSNTATSSPTPSGTATLTPTGTQPPTNTPTSTGTATRTFTPTSTASTTPSATASPTVTITPSSTASWTSTASPTRTSTVTATSTFTNRPTSSSTATFTSTASRTPTTTATLTSTSTGTSTPVNTITATRTSTPTGTGGVVLFPNPVTGSGPVTIQISLGVFASQVRIEVFTTAFRRVNEITLSNVPVGITDVGLPLTDREGKPLANGLYYVVVQTPQGRFIVKLLVTR